MRGDLLSHQRLHLRLSRGECRLVLVDTVAAVIIGTIRALVLAILVSRGAALVLDLLNVIRQLAVAGVISHVNGDVKGLLIV